jgi:hypothetical protein
MTANYTASVMGQRIYVRGQGQVGMNAYRHAGQALLASLMIWGSFTTACRLLPGCLIRSMS